MKVDGYQFDVRGEGGLVVAAGSVHESGHVYTAVQPDAEVVPIPGEIAALLGGSPSIRQTTDADTWLMDRTEEWLKRAAATGHGERDTFCHKYASSMRSRGLERTEAETLMTAAWEHLLDKETHPFAVGEAVAKVAQVWDRYEGPECRHDVEPDGGGNSWGTPLSLNVTDEYEPTEPTILRREDGQCLIYPGLTHSFHGEAESGKSMVIQYVVGDELRAGHDVLYVDFESDPHEVAGRLRAMGAEQSAVDRHLTYIQPCETFASAAPGWLALLEHRYSLVVLDGVTEAMVLAGKSPLDNQEAAEWLRMLPNDIARRTGAAVVMIDHVTKSSDGRGRSAIGAQHKLAGITGAAYVVEPIEHLGRGVRGVVALRVAKDRPGAVRAACGEYRRSDRTQEAARVIVDATGPGLDFAIKRWIPEARPVDKSLEKALTIANLLENHRAGLNQSEISAKTRASGVRGLANGSVVGAVLAPLMAVGLVTTRTGPKGSHIYQLGVGVTLQVVQNWAEGGGYLLHED